MVGNWITMEIARIAVLGAGQMGNGTTQVAALAGFSVTMIDIEQEYVDKGMSTIENSLGKLVGKERISQVDADAALSRINTTTERSYCSDADLVIEAIPEIPELKFSTFSELDEICKPEAILASNTSSISITELGKASGRPAQFIGMHFMNPVPLMELVEVIRGRETSDAACETVMELARDMGKTPVEANDFPGFVANRILMPMLNEACYALMEGVAEAEAIDTVMKLGMNHPMGPLALADYIGLGTCLSIMEVLHRGFENEKYLPCPLLREKVAAGHLGRKSGRGFYEYG